MSQNKAGDIVGIRDWSNRYFYNKDEIADFFIRCNQSGLKAYKLTIVAIGQDTLTIAESNSITNPQSYTVIIPEDGVYIGLFFFHANAVVYINGQSYTLNSYDEFIVAESGYGSVTLQNKSSVSQKSYGVGQTIFTSDARSLYLMLNIDINNEATSSNLTSEIVTDGTMYASAVTTDAYSSGVRNIAIKAAVDLIDSGNDATFSNTNSGGGYTIQSHLVFKMLTGYIPYLTHVEHSFKPDAGMGASKTVNIAAGDYLAVALSEGVVGSGTMAASITSAATVKSNVTFGNEATGIKVGGSAAIIEAASASTITFDFTSPTSYCTRGYIIYRLDAAA